jgi:hypothetical protein
MGATVGNFRDLVRKAYEGELKLPGFQRTFRWRPDKVVKLYDSLRLKYPIGSFLFLQGAGETLAPRVFNGSAEEAADKQTAFLVLDGQQRLTSGVHLFYPSGKRQYFIDLNKLEALVVENSIDLENEPAVAGFCASIDFEDGYLISKPSVTDPRSLLINNDLLCTSIVTNAISFNVASSDYVDAKPGRKNLMLRLVQPHFSLHENDGVPHIDIDEKTSISAISRIFTTLNTTGQMLTPFELVVASLFPSQIDLQKEVNDFRSEGKYYPQMDATGEILLQTIAMSAGVDQKKSNLPREITAPIYVQHKKAAFRALEELGEFLTSNLGCGLNITGSLVPYDAIYAPMARALQHIKDKGITGPDLAEAHRKLRLWFAASALTQRYQEGVHNKQTRDFREMVAWIDGTGNRPDWIGQAQTPSLRNKSFDGAIGKFVQCCINHRDPRDPVVVAHKVGFRSDAMTTEKHHIYPSKFVQHLSGWDKKLDKADTLLNMMFVERGTNKSWLNADPRNHINEAKKAISEQALIENYHRQFISTAAFELLTRSEKTTGEFYEFLDLRQAEIRNWITEHFGIQHQDAIESDDDELSLDEELVEAT